MTSPTAPCLPPTRHPADVVQKAYLAARGKFAH
jgi:hypothetical protein